MRKTLFTFLFFSIFLFKGYCQLEKGTTQVGISVLPVFDVLKIFPDNKISGIAVSGNLGYLTIKNMSLGIQPYYSQVTNSYDIIAAGAAIREKQNIKLYGLNTYLRYYFISKEKLLLYAQGSAGFGNFEQKTSYPSSLTFVKNSHTNKSISTFLLGVGGNYFIAKNFAIELNVPYIYVKQFSTPQNDFHTVAPTIGFQFYWK